ncbi:hypothetical protein Trydic_g11108 [Trypoxylus dichotomus]
MEFINPDIILIEDDLEYDLQLQLLYSSVTNRAVAFPHSSALPFTRSLKFLMPNTSKKEIQIVSNGRSNWEDSNLCLELMTWKVRTDFEEVNMFKTYTNF